MTKANAKPKASKAQKASRSRGTGAPQKILDFTLTLEGRLGMPQIPRKMIAAAAGVKSTTIPVTLSTMKKQGLIMYDKDTISLTAAGRSRAQPVDAGTLFDNDKVQADVKAKYKVGGMAGLLFDVLTDGRIHDRGAVAASIGCTNKATLAVMLSNLKKKGIIEYDRTTICLTDMCFAWNGRPE